MHDDWTAEGFRPPRPPGRRRANRRWLAVAGATLALLLTLGVGVLLGSRMIGAQAASFVPGQTLASTPGAHGPGQCDALTITSVSGQTITATARDGGAVTIHTSSGTQYTKAGQAATASAVTVGSHIHVQGTRNSDGSINATSIDVQ